MAEWTIGFRMLGEIGTANAGRTVYTFMGYSGQSTDPVPLVYVDDVLQTSGYTYAGGSASVHTTVTFAVAQSVGAVVRLTYRWTVELDAESEPNAHEVTPVYNVKSGMDVNGLGYVNESYYKTGPREVVVGWAYITDTFYEQLYDVSCEPGAAMDITRLTVPASVLSISNFYILEGPKYAGIPGVPSRCHATMKLVELQ